MKKVAIVALFAATVLTSGVTAYLVQKTSGGGSPVAVSWNNEKVPAHFTNNPKDSYPDLTYAAETAVHTVVSIEKKEEVRMRPRAGYGYNPFFEYFGFPQQEGQGQGRNEERPSTRMERSSGSGVIISSDGYIVSNNHVTENATELVVTLYDGRMFDARIIGSDPSSDLSLIKVEAKDLPFIPIGNSDDLRLGEWVIAIGAPYELASTITAGIISAKARSLQVIEGDDRIESFLQTDAAVNPGNSGGALVNTRGELVGINSVIMSPTGTFTGYSFAVPSSIVKKVAADLKEYGIVQRALIGIGYNEIDDAFVKEFGEKTGIKESGGIYVGEVMSGGAAEAAAIKVGDVITSVDGMKVGPGGYNLQEIIVQRRPGDKVNISLKRGNETKQIEVTLRNKAGKEELLDGELPEYRTALGGTFKELTESEKEAFNVDFGIKVADVTSNDGILTKAGIRRGYVITRINDRPIRSLADLDRINSEIESFEVVTPDGRTFRSYSMSK